jgi:hypothetical protein
MDRSNGKEAFPVLTFWDIPSERRGAERYGYFVHGQEIDQVDDREVNMKTDKMVAVIKFPNTELAKEYRRRFDEVINAVIRGENGEELFCKLIEDTNAGGYLEILRKGLDVKTLSSLLLKSEVEGMVTNEVRTCLFNIAKLKEGFGKDTVIESAKSSIDLLAGLDLDRYPTIKRYRDYSLDELRRQLS